MKNNRMKSALLLMTAMLSIVLLASCIDKAGIVVAPPEQEAPVETKQNLNEDNYLIERIERIIEKVIDREVIEDVYFRYLGDNDALIEELKKHNERTGYYTAYFSQKATQTMIWVFQLEDESGSPFKADWATAYIKLPSDVQELIEIITHYSLYRNFSELFLCNPKLAFVISSEWGRFSGDVPFFWTRCVAMFLIILIHFYYAST